MREGSGHTLRHPEVVGEDFGGPGVASCHLLIVSPWDIQHFFAQLSIIYHRA